MASNGWENYKKRKGLSVERAAAENTESVSGWEQYKRNKARESQAQNGALAVNPIKRGTYRSEVTAQYDPDDYKNERLAEQAYRIFAGEEEKTSSPSTLRVGAGSYAAERVPGSFVGTLTQEYIREETEEKTAGKLRDLTDYAKEMRDRLEGPNTLKVGAGETITPPKTSLRVGAGEKATATEGPGWKLNDMELFEDMLAGKTVQQPRIYDEAFVGPIGQYDTRDDIYAPQPGKKIGAGENARLDPELIGYENLKHEPDFAQILSAPQKLRAADPFTEARTGLSPAEYTAALTQYMTGEEKNNYQYLLNKYGETEADKYYSTLQDSLNQRQGLYMALRSEEMPAWQRELMELFTAGASGLENTIGGLRNVWNALTQNEQTQARPATTYAKTAMAENNGFWGNLALDLAEGVGQQIPQMLTAPFAGVMGKVASKVVQLAPLTGSVIGNTYNEELRAGKDPKDALKKALSAGSLEAGLEVIGGPAFLSGGVLTGKAIDNIVDGIEGGVKRYLARTGFDALGEAAEEALSGLLSPLIDKALSGGEEGEWDWDEIVYQTLIGGISGSLMGQPGNIVAGVQENREKAAQQTVEAAATGVKNPENTQEQKSNAAKAALEAAGVESERIDEVAGAVAKIVNGVDATQEELELLGMTDGALEVAQTIAETKTEPKEQGDGEAAAADVQDDIAKPGEDEEAPEERKGMTLDAETNRELAIEKTAKLGGERRIHEEIYDMGDGKQNAEAYGMEYERAYNRGRNSMPLTDQVARTYKTLTQEQVQAAWNAGRAQQQAIDQKRTGRAKSVTGAQGLVDARELAGTKLNANQRAAMRSASYVANALGIKVVWHKSQVNAEGKRTSPNGWYVAKDRSVHLDIYAGSDSEQRGEMYRYAAMRTFAHELTHMIEDTSPQQYSELRAMVFDHLEKKGYSVEAMISEKQRAGQSRYTATQELVADACEMMLQDTDALKAEMAKNPSLWERIKTAFGKFVKDLRKALEGVRATSKEAMALMEEADGVLRYAEELQKKWDEALLSTRQADAEEANVLTTETEQTAPEAEQSAQEADQTSEEPEQTVPEAEQSEQPRRREGVTLMEERDWESIKDRSMRPFAEEVPEAREWFAMAAELLQEDLAASTPGQKRFIRDEAGNLVQVTGQERKTVDEIAQLLDHGMTYRNISDVLDAYAQTDMDWIGKHPQTAKKAELMLDQMLMEGYTNIEGERVPGAEDYRALTDELAGRETKEPAEYDLGEDVRFSGREETEFEEDKYFARRIDAFEAVEETEKNKKRGYIKVGKVQKGSVLNRIGLPATGLYFDESKINEQLTGHNDHIDKEVLKKIPAILRDPIIISEYKENGNIDVFGDVWAGSSPVVVGIVISRSRGGYAVVNKVRTIHARRNYAEKLEPEKLLYVTPDRKRAQSWFQANRRADAAWGGTPFTPTGLIRSIAQDEEVVNPDIRYQPREEDQISDRELLATALESVAQNAEERRILAEYKGKIKELDAKQRQADVLRENMFRKGISREAMMENQKRYRQLMEEMTRADRKLLELEAAAPMNTILKRERLNIHRRVQETRTKALAEYRERRNSTEARAVMRRTIVTQTNRLKNRLESPKGGQYFIQDEMRDYVSTLVKAFTPRADDGLFPEIELAQVQAAYKNMFKDNPNLAENYDENIEEDLGELASILPGKRMAQLTMEQLRTLRECMDHTMDLVTNGESVFAEGRRQTVESWADPTIGKAGEDGKYLKQRWVEGAREFLNIANARPIDFFERIGGPLERLYREFEKGEAAYGQDLWEAREVQRNLQKKYNYEKWADAKDDVLEFTTTYGKKLEIDRETALALWATRERERRNPDDKVRHLEQGGFKMLKTDKWEKQGKKGWNFLNQKQEVGTELYRLSDIDNDRIANWLTAEQKGYATEMVRYLSTDIAEKGNEVSKILNGYSIFGEGFYFPYRTSADYRSKNLGQVENAMLKNMGFTKRVRKYAGNPIVIDGFTKVWEEHVNQMAMYHGMAIPQNTFWRVYNYVMPAGKDKDGKDHKYESVRAAVKGAYGEGADKYIEQLMIDIYGGVKRTYGDSLGAKLASKFKRNAVTMSMSVVVQQYSSIARAFAVISPKYFASLQGNRFKAAKAEMLRYSATAKIKNMGRFDMNDGRSAVEWLDEKDYTGAGFLNRTKEFFKDAEMRERFYGYLPKLVDEKVWTQIWKAAKRETAEKTGLTGDALCKATAERFDQIIRETQVYDSVLVRSQLMRDKGGWATTVTSFMGEPTVSYNMFMKAVRLAKNKEYKKASAYLTAIEAAVVFNAVLKAIVTAWRDKDEDETYWEKFIAHIVGDLTGNVLNTKMGPVSVVTGGLTSPLLPLGNIPYVSDIMEVFQGYDVTRNDMNVAADMYNAFTAAFSEEKSVGEKLRAWAKPFSALTGLPISNVERDFMGVLNLFINDKRELQDTTARGVKYAILAELGRKDTESAETQRMLDAALKGDMKEYEALRVHVSEDLGLTDKEIVSALKSRIHERYEYGGIDAETAVRMLEKYGDMANTKEDKYEAEREVRKWDVKMETDNNTLYGRIWNNITDWDGRAIQKEIKELKKLGVEESQIRSSVLGHFKQIYLDAKGREKTDLKAHLIAALTYMGDTSAEAKQRIKKWEEEE